MIVGYKYAQNILYTYVQLKIQYLLVLNFRAQKIFSTYLTKLEQWKQRRLNKYAPKLDTQVFVANVNGRLYRYVGKNQSVFSKLFKKSALRRCVKLVMIFENHNFV